MKKIIVGVVAVVAALMLPALAKAEIRAGSFEVGPYAGFHVFDEDNHVVDDQRKERGKVDQAFFGTSHHTEGFNRRFVYGLRLGYNLTERWGVEAAYDHVGSRANMYHADVVYHFTPERAFVPFAVAGLGYANIKPMGRDHYNTMMGDFGLGFKYFLHRNVALRVDLRDVVTNMQNVVATAGITFAFGGKTPAPAPEPAPAPAPAPKPTPPPAPVPAPKPEVKPAPAPAPVKIVLEDVHFDFDKATLTNEAKAILAKDINTLKTNPSIKVQVEGHTCAHGKDDYNMALGERRANAVKEFLVKEGIAADRLTTISYGETRLAMPEIPTANNKNSKEAKENRRVHFEVISK